MSNVTPRARSGLLWDDDPRLPQLEEMLWPSDGQQKGLIAQMTTVTADICAKNGGAVRHEMVE